MVQILFGAERHMNTNLLTGSSVGGGNRREKGGWKNQIKVENRFIHIERIWVLRGCVSMYTVIKFLCFYSNSKAGSI